MGSETHGGSCGNLGGYTIGESGGNGEYVSWTPIGIISSS